MIGLFKKSSNIDVSFSFTLIKFGVMKWIKHCYKIPHENILKNKLHRILSDLGEKRRILHSKEEEKNHFVKNNLFIYTF
jgi:hypothetical protein